MCVCVCVCVYVCVCVCVYLPTSSHVQNVTQCRIYIYGKKNPGKHLFCF